MRIWAAIRCDGASDLTVLGVGRPINMESKPKRLRRNAGAAVLLCAVASVQVMANPSIRRPVAQFIHFYQQSDDLNVWERVVYSWLLARSTAPSS